MIKSKFQKTDAVYVGDDLFVVTKVTPVDLTYRYFGTSTVEPSFNYELVHAITDEVITRNEKQLAIYN